MISSIPQVLSSEEVGFNFNDWNSLRNSYNLTTKDGLRYPKSLIKSAWGEFCWWAIDYHVDTSKYRFARVSRFEGVTWQVEFHTTKDPTGPHVTISDIFYNTKRRQIMQRCISIS